MGQSVSCPLCSNDVEPTVIELDPITEYSGTARIRMQCPICLASISMKVNYSESASIFINQLLA